MRYISKQQLLTLTLCFGVFLALGTVGAYTGPTASPTGNNTSEPILENTAPQDKPGNLSVNAFYASLSSAFLQNTTFNGVVSGGTENTTNSTLRFGDGSHTTSIAVTGSLRTNKTFQSDSLAHSGPGLRPLCADADGNLFLCAGTTPVGPSCGNNLIESGEQCDDGNTINGDGCSSSCQTEQPPVGTTEFTILSVSNFADFDGNYAVCTAGLNQPAPLPAEIVLRYVYTTQGEFPAMLHQRECYLTVDQGASLTQESEYLSSLPNDINSVCYVSGSNTYPVNPNSVPAC